MQAGSSTLDRRTFLTAGGAALAAAALAGQPWSASAAAAAEGARRRPNIIVVLADDLGYGELGSYGQQLISTPILDRMAGEGVRYTDFYAGGPVCAPSRCSMLTGLHSGHSTVRNNPEPGQGDEPFRADEVTFALLLQSVGYRTGLVGKWGFSPDDGTHYSAPLAQGFDEFFGYLTHTHAHNYYPGYLWNGTERVTIPAGSYAPDLFADRALQFVDAHHADPFLLFYSTNIPHFPQQVPELGQYASTSWSEGDKAHAAQITRMDRDMGRLVDKLEEHGIADDTVILFLSDNGPHEEGSPAHDPVFFDANGPLRGYKRNIYEGGIRVPAILWAPGLVGDATPPVDATPWAMWDILPTLADLAGAPVPPFVDGRSMRSSFDATVPVAPTRPLYWWRLEPYTTARANAEEGGRVRNAAEALRHGDWKAVRYAPDRTRDVPDASWSLELYNLATDLGETTNVAPLHPEVAASLVALMRQSWTDPSTTRPSWNPNGLEVSAPAVIAAGGTAEVRVAFTNHIGRPLQDLWLELAVPDGWTASAPIARRLLLPGRRAQEAVFQVTAPEGGDGGTVPIEAVARFKDFRTVVEVRHDVAMRITGLPIAQTAYVSDLEWVSATNGWGPVERDRSNGKNGAGDGPAISIKGQQYAKGLGVHPASEVVVHLGGGGTRFTSIIGIDDFSANQGAKGSVVFQVWADDAKLYDSGLVTAATSPRTVDVALPPAELLRLVVTDSGNGAETDHSSWAEAKIHVG